MWAIGVMVHAALLGALPFESSDIDSLIEKVTAERFTSANLNTTEHTLSAACSTMLVALLNYDATQRLTSNEFAACAWLQEAPPLNNRLSLLTPGGLGTHPPNLPPITPGPNAAVVGKVQSATTNTFVPPSPSSLPALCPLSASSCEAGMPISKCNAKNITKAEGYNGSISTSLNHANNNGTDCTEVTKAGTSPSTMNVAAIDAVTEVTEVVPTRSGVGSDRIVRSAVGAGPGVR
jgi:hypothetical protein